MLSSEELERVHDVLLWQAQMDARVGYSLMPLDRQESSINQCFPDSTVYYAQCVINMKALLSIPEH